MTHTILLLEVIIRLAPRALTTKEKERHVRNITCKALFCFIDGTIDESVVEYS